MKKLAMFLVVCVIFSMFGSFALASDTYNWKVLKGGLVGGKSSKVYMKNTADGLQFSGMGSIDFANNSAVGGICRKKVYMNHVSLSVTFNKVAGYMPEVDHWFALSLLNTDKGILFAGEGIYMLMYPFKDKTIIQFYKNKQGPVKIAEKEFATAPGKKMELSFGINESEGKWVFKLNDEQIEGDLKDIPLDAYKDGQAYLSLASHSAAEKNRVIFTIHKVQTFDEPVSSPVADNLKDWKVLPGALVDGKSSPVEAKNTKEGVQFTGSGSIDFSKNSAMGAVYKNGVNIKDMSFSMTMNQTAGFMPETDHWFAISLLNTDQGILFAGEGVYMLAYPFKDKTIIQFYKNKNGPVKIGEKEFATIPGTKMNMSFRLDDNAEKWIFALNGEEASGNINDIPQEVYTDGKAYLSIASHSAQENNKVTFTVHEVVSK